MEDFGCRRIWTVRRPIKQAGDRASAGRNRLRALKPSPSVAHAGRLDPRTGRLIVMSAEDNLVKGASGQAVQSMNLMCGFPETEGLLA